MPCTTFTYSRPSSTTVYTSSTASYICVLYSTFVSLSTTSSGGAISCSSASLSVRGSLFTACSASTNSGAIDFSSGNFTIDTCCFTFCTAGTYMAFHAVTSSTLFSTANKSTVACCAPSYSSAYNYHSHEYLGGTVSVGNTNSSSNNAYSGGSAQCFSGALVASSENCNFYNCSGPLAVYAYSSSTAAYYRYCNFAYNTRAGTSQVILVLSSTAYVYYSVFVENSGSTVFDFSSGSATVTGCVSNVAYASSGVTNSGSTVSLTGTYSINLLTNRMCLTVHTKIFTPGCLPTISFFVQLTSALYVLLD